MDLEQRVKVLEQEVAILKNQIQTTLLDIQEQILVNQFPALRADSVPSDPQPLPRMEAPHDASTAAGNGNGNGNGNGHYHAEPAPAKPDPELAPAEEPTVEPAPIEASGVVPPPKEWFGAPSDATWATLNAMMEWLQQSIERVGEARTAKQIEIYAQNKLLPLEVKDALLDMLALYESGESLDKDEAEWQEWEATRAEIEGQEDDWPVYDDLPKKHHNGNGHTAQGGSEHDRKRQIILRLIAGLKNTGTGESYG